MLRVKYFGEFLEDDEITGSTYHKNIRRPTMYKKIIPVLLSFSMILPLQSFASSTEPMLIAQQAQGLTTEERAELTGTRKQLATIIFAGLSGAILGLSTLSFYGRPQDHLSNIAIGFAFGVIGGVTFTTYKAATKPYEAYDISKNFDDESSLRAQTQARAEYQPKISWSWEF